MTNIVMKTLARVGAVTSFLFCFLGGVCILKPALSATREDGFVLAALGLFLIGLAFFFGSILWLTGERFCSKQHSKCWRGSCAGSTPLARLSRWFVGSIFRFLRIFRMAFPMLS